MASRNTVNKPMVAAVFGVAGAIFAALLSRSDVDARGLLCSFFWFLVVAVLLFGKRIPALFTDELHDLEPRREVEKSEQRLQGGTNSETDQETG